MADVTVIFRIVPLALAILTPCSFAQEQWGSVIGTDLRVESDEAFSIDDGTVLAFPEFGKEGGLSPVVIKNRLSAVRTAPQPDMRGAKEARLYAELSPRVVMVITNEAIGSGTLIGDSATVLTNWHVIENYDTVGVIYKPSKEGQTPSAADIRRAKVVRLDEVADLALLKVEAPATGKATISLGDLSEIPVGSDVHAIGHPTGESWTYTKGFVSQMRQDYEWVTESGKVHRADVVQTQTPINPGNSGGPLLSDTFKLVGVNSFKAEGEALNFAVGVDEVRAFLARKENRYAAGTKSAGSATPPEHCELEWMGSEPSKDPAGTKYFADIDCDGIIDAFRLEPDDPNDAIYFSADTTGNDSVDTIFIDTDRDGAVDLSMYDTNGDGEPDVLGYHRNGELEPYKYEELG